MIKATKIMLYFDISEIFNICRNSSESVNYVSDYINYAMAVVRKNKKQVNSVFNIMPITKLSELNNYIISTNIFKTNYLSSFKDELKKGYDGVGIVEGLFKASKIDETFRTIANSYFIPVAPLSHFLNPEDNTILQKNRVLIKSEITTSRIHIPRTSRGPRTKI